MIHVGNGYVAKTVCSGIFVSGRPGHAIRDGEIYANDPGILRLASTEVDRGQRIVRTRMLGVGERVAVYRGRLGCTLAEGVAPQELHRRGLPEAVAAAPSRLSSEPIGASQAGATASAARVDRAALDAALDEALAEPGPVDTKRTRAVVVALDGEIIAERYAPKYGPDVPLAGWSMTKSAVNALVGVLVREGKLSLDATLDVPEWRAPGDGRAAITMRHLLQMTSGLAFAEDYRNPLGDALWMLFGTGDAAHFAASKALVAPPGQRWSYSSGTTNIVARVLRRAAGGNEADYLAFPRRALFEPLGLASAVIEPDAAGTFVGSSFMFASARDWVRLGQLYLQDGVWDGVRILPEGWVAFSRSPAPAAPGGVYGAHFWLRLPRLYAPSGEAGLPEDAYHAVGHEGQILTIVPSRGLVVVRLGLSLGHGTWDHAAFLRRVLQAIR